MRLSTVILAVAMFGVFGMPGHAQNARSKPGAPAEMIGYFGTSPAACRSWNRKLDGVIHITSEHMTSCSGVLCESRIVSHTRTKSGFRLFSISPGNPSGWSSSYRMISFDVFELHDGKRVIETMSRCTERDVIAGIGREPGAESHISKGYEALFSAYYAKGIPGYCRRLKVDAGKVEEVIQAASLAVYKYRLNDRVNPVQMSQLDEIVEDAKVSAARDAMDAVEKDAEAVSDFAIIFLAGLGLRGQ